MSSQVQTVKVGLLGCGIVGGSTARILRDHASEIAQRAGVEIEVSRVAVRSLAKTREIEFPPEVLTTDPWQVVTDPDVQIVVEVMGGIEPARDLILEAIKNGKHVVSANKELLSTLGQDVMEAADAAGVDLLFEASVGGGIPIIRPMKESLAGDRVRRVMGIVNGTTNFILTRMSETGESFAEALEEAERLGYTELDPSADIEGFDAAQKLAILASIAFNARVRAGDVHREGISKVTSSDIAAAHDLGYEVKLLAVAELDEGEISARVHTAMIPKTHPLASVRDVFNAVFVEGEEVGRADVPGTGSGRTSDRFGRRGRHRRDRKEHRHRRASRPVVLATPKLGSGRRTRRTFATTSCSRSSISLVSCLTLPARSRITTFRSQAFGKKGSGDEAITRVGHAHRDRRRAPGDVHRSAVTGRREEHRLDDAGRGRFRARLIVATGPLTVAGKRGVIRRYFDYLPVSEATPIVTLDEGDTPLIYSERLSTELDAQVWLKYEGLNPTGSFKDRGMTLAISKALEEGSRVVVCASTGNTSASASAYAARANMVCAVSDPPGKRGAGQARASDGARRARPRDRRQLRRCFEPDQGDGRVSADHDRQLHQSVSHRRSEDAAFEIVEALDALPTFTRCRWAMRGTSPLTGAVTARPSSTGGPTHCRRCVASRPRGRTRSCAARSSTTPRRSRPR